MVHKELYITTKLKPHEGQNTIRVSSLAEYVQQEKSPYVGYDGISKDGKPLKIIIGKIETEEEGTQAQAKEEESEHHDESEHEYEISDHTKESDSESKENSETPSSGHSAP